MLHKKGAKTSKQKGFSLIELLVVVAIIGVLAAVAIPAYQKYQTSAKLAVINSSLNQLVKAYSACRAVSTVTLCATDSIDNTLQAQKGTKITKTAGTGSAPEACFYIWGGSDNNASTPKYSVKGEVVFEKDSLKATLTAAVTVPAVVSSAPTCAAPASTTSDN